MPSPAPAPAGPPAPAGGPEKLHRLGDMTPVGAHRDAGVAGADLVLVPGADGMETRIRSSTVLRAGSGAVVLARHLSWVSVTPRTAGCPPLTARQGDLLELAADGAPVGERLRGQPAASSRSKPTPATVTYRPRER